MKNRSKKRKHFGGRLCFDFFSDFGGEKAVGTILKIAENRAKSKKCRSGDGSLFSEVPGKGFRLICERFGEGSEGMSHRFSIDLECDFWNSRNPIPNKTHSR